MENIYIPNDVYEFIADNIASNIRELEGALIRVIAYSSLVKSEINLDVAKEALKDILSANKTRVINCDIIMMLYLDTLVLKLMILNQRRYAEI